ncbi:MAG TPA: SgcJ/EcaC family oxidoreductase [Bryobacteraceae bacterium]|nr:SgcJ/EcaC family oxidoreductase [Bryobacteraceae bacterium]
MDHSTAQREVAHLYQDLLDAWNHRDARAMAALFSEDSTVIGFDGSTMNGPAEIEASLAPIFAHHPTAAYISKVRSIRVLTDDVAVLHAVVGMVPPGKADINPAVNAIQILVAIRQNAAWRIATFQNTPAAFHGRPEVAEVLTAELRETLHSQSTKT